ncbi:hypothetical protein REPUB_Repub18cG0173700 [Reevesia pubescens]
MFEVLVRDGARTLIDGVGGSFKADSAIFAKAVVCKNGVKLAMKKCYNKVVLEIDSENLFGYLTKGDADKN